MINEESSAFILLNLIKPLLNGEYIPLQDKSMQLNKANRIMGTDKYSGEASYFKRF
jgi:hypothetical protein